MSERRRRSDFVVSIFVTVVWAAVVFMVDGVIAALLDRDPIGPAIGPYYALIALLLAAVVVWFAVGIVQRAESPWLTALTATALVYLVLVATAVPVGLGLVADQAASPFVIAAALLAGLTVVLSWRFLRSWWPHHPG